MTSKFFEKFNELFTVIADLETLEESREFFEDLCTIKELDSMNQRLEVAKLLYSGKNYQEICKITGASSATISRVNRCLTYNEGYKNVIKKLVEKSK